MGIHLKKYIKVYSYDLVRVGIKHIEFLMKAGEQI